MVTALDRKLLRDLRRLKGQVATIAVVVACGIASYVTLQSTWRSLHYSKEAYYERYRFADMFASLRRAPDTLEAQIESISGVAQAQTRVVQLITVPMPGMVEPASARLVSLPDYGQPPLNDIYLRHGRLPEPGVPDEVVVVEPFAVAHGLEPGDTIQAVIASRMRKLKVVGVGLSPEFIFVFAGGMDFAPEDKRSAVMWMRRSMMAPAFQMDGAFNDVVLRLQPNASEEAVTERLDLLLEPYGGLGTIPRAKQMSNFFISGELEQLEKMATVVPFIFLAVAAFLLNIVLSRLVYLQRQQIAALKALGYSNRQVGLHYLKMVSVIVVLGSLLGVAAGSYLGKGLTELYMQYFRFPTLVYRLDITTATIAVGVSLVAAVVGALLSVRQVAAMKPAEAMRDQAPASYKSGWLDKLALPALLGVPAMMVIREIRRRPLRVLISSFGIACAVAIMVVGRFSYDSFDHLINVLYHEEQRGDMTVGFLEPQPVGAEHQLEQIPGILDAEGMRLVPVRFRAGSRYRDSVINGLPDERRLRHLLDRDGNVVRLPDRGLALSRKLGEILGVGIGALVEVEIREGNRGKYLLPVVALVDDAFGLQGYMNLTALHRLLRQERAITLVQLRIDPRFLTEIHDHLKELRHVGQVTEKAWVIERFRQQSAEMMWLMTLILSGFGAAIAIGVVYNNARVALSLRSRDLSSLRVLGFSRREISSILLGELAVQLIIGIPSGLALGTWWSDLIMNTVDPETYRFAIVISMRTYAYAAAIALAAGIISALLVRRKLDRLDLIAVLKTRE